MSGFLGNVTAGQVFATPVQATPPPKPSTAAPASIGAFQNKAVATDAGNANGENQAQAQSAVTQQSNILPGFAQLGLQANGSTSAASPTGTPGTIPAMASSVTTQAVKSPLVSAIGEQVTQPAPSSAVNASGLTTDLADSIGEQPSSTLQPVGSTTQFDNLHTKIPDAIGENVTNSANAQKSSTNAGPVLPPIRQ